VVHLTGPFFHGESGGLNRGARLEKAGTNRREGAARLAMTEGGGLCHPLLFILPGYLTVLPKMGKIIPKMGKIHE
jgi:hypothetical protein